MNRRNFLKIICFLPFASLLKEDKIQWVNKLETNVVKIEHRKLKARWTYEASQDLMAMHEINSKYI